MSAYEQAYPPTPPGSIEMKVIPAAVAIEAERSGTSASRDSLFMSLFRYISRHDVAMTVPVEADGIEPHRMRFFIGTDARHRALPDEGGVRRVARPERRVLAVGLRGGYGPATFERGRAELERWIANQPDWRSAGEPQAVYWNGPMVPWFMKRSEVHVPVERVASPASGLP